MKLFGPQPDTNPTNCYPNKAENHASLEAAKEHYQAFVWECEHFGATPLDLWLYAGEASGDEEKYGYPDYPDYILSVGPRGGITHQRTKPTEEEAANLSINQKIILCLNLSMQLVDPCNEGRLDIDEETTDMIFVHADGLRAKHLNNMRDGRCSLQSSMDFDIAKEEERLDSDATELRRLIALVSRS